VEKDREISRVRAECDRLLKDSAKQMSSLDDNLWQEKRNGIRLQDSLIHQTETVQLLQDKVSEVGLNGSFERAPPMAFYQHFSVSSLAQSKIVCRTI
jgi:hypothetical protein